VATKTRRNPKQTKMNQKPNIIEKLDLSVIKHEMDLKAAYKELNNENLTQGESRAVHLEIEHKIYKK